MTTDTIHIPLLDEGTVVSRPTQGISLGNNLYRVLATPNYNPEDEHWKFPPGSIVRCETKASGKEKILIACELAVK